MIIVAVVVSIVAVITIIIIIIVSNERDRLGRISELFFMKNVGS